MEAVNNGLQLGRIVIERGLAHDGKQGVCLMVELLEPKFVSLVNDDEEHFIVCRFVAFVTLRVLGMQYPVQLKIFMIVDFVHGAKIVGSGKEVHGKTLRKGRAQRAFVWVPSLRSLFAFLRSLRLNSVA